MTKNKDLPEQRYQIILFEDKNIRRIWNEDEWYYSVVDFVGILTDSTDPKDYWYKVKTREEENGVQLSTNCRQLKLIASDGKKYKTDCANNEGLLRIIQSIPSKKAEPIKLWLAEVGRERLEEMQNPELAMHRMQEEYKKRGYDEKWIDVRIRGIITRKELTDQWKQRGAKEGKEYAVLTNEMTKETFNLNIKDYKEHKYLDSKDNLRDHMTPMELILTMLGEETSKEIHKSRDSQGIVELKTDVKDAGKIAQKTRLEIEDKTGKSVVSPDNFLSLDTSKIKQLKNNKKADL
jgi:DNA-damage-inducible protein D